MKYFQNDSVLDILYPARCPVCGCIVHDMRSHRKTGTLKRRLKNAPAVCELICKLCFFDLPFVVEPYCMICGRPVEGPLSDRCGDCRCYPHAFREARAVFSYKGTVMKSLYQLKYGGRKEYARFFAASIAQYLSGWILARDISVIVSVPLYPSRQKKRGYNQAEEIAVRLGEYLGLPVCPDLLIREKETIAQKNLDRQARMKNLKGAFCINTKKTFPGLRGKRVLLLDDIYTTGATADAAASVLMEAGSAAVFVCAVAVTG